MHLRRAARDGATFQVAAQRHVLSEVGLVVRRHRERGRWIKRVENRPRSLIEARWDDIVARLSQRSREAPERLPEDVEIV